MWPNWRRSILLLLIATVGTEAWAAPPKVLVTASVDPAIARWARWSTNDLRLVEQTIVIDAIAIFKQKFPFLEWTTAAQGNQGRLQLTLMEQTRPPCTAKPGACPWMIHMLLQADTEQFKECMRLMTPGEAHTLIRQAQRSGKSVSDTANTALDRMDKLKDGLTAEDFVARMLSHVDVAHDIRPSIRNVSIGVAKDELKADQGTMFRATFVRIREFVDLQYIDASVDEPLTRTSCRITTQPVQDWMKYVAEHEPAEPVHVGVQSYVLDNKEPTSGVTALHSHD